MDTPTPAETLQHMNAIIWEQQSINGEQWVEEHVTIMGDRKKSPSREVQDTVLTENEPPADNTWSHRPSIKEVEDKDSPKLETREIEEMKMAIAKEWLRQRQETDEEERQHQKEQARERMRRTWKKWKGPLQR